MNNIPTKLAYKWIELVRLQIEQGIDIDGKPYAYSKKPFFMPYSDKVVSKMGGKSGKGKLYEIIQKEDSKLGLIIKGGYESYKQAMAKSMDFLTWSGAMLAAMTTVDTAYTYAVVGFNNLEAGKRAFYFNISGVGTSRKLWKFFGLTNDNQAIFDKYAEDLIAEEML